MPVTPAPNLAAALMGGGATGGPSGGGGYVPDARRKQILKNRGFRVSLLKTPHGLNDAWKAYTQGVQGRHWSQAYAQRYAASLTPYNAAADFSRGRPASPVPGDTSGQGNVYSFQRGNSNTPNIDGTVPTINDIMGMIGTGGPMPTLNLPGMPRIPKGLLRGLNPGKFDGKAIRQMVNSSYAPLIQALETQLKASGLQGEQNLADIGSWFGQLKGVGQENAAADATASAAAAGGYNQGVQGFINAIGGSANPAAADVAKSGAAGAAGLAGIAAAQGNFDRNLDRTTSLAQTDQLAREKGRASQEALEIQSQLTQTRGQRSSDLMKALFEGKERHYDKKLNFLNLKNSLGQQNFQNAIQIAQMQFEAQNMAAQANNPAELIKSAIDIQYGLLRNQNEQNAGGMTQNEALAEQLSLYSAQLGIAQQELNLAQDQQPETSRPQSSASVSRMIGDITGTLGIFDEDGVLTGRRYKDTQGRVAQLLRSYGLDPFHGQGNQIRVSILRGLGIG